MDIFTKSKRSEIMSKIRSKDTKPEILMRKALSLEGLRYRLHANRLPGSPDIILNKYKLAIQVRGCFWHQHNCASGRFPKSKKSYWVTKLRKNMARDKKNDRKIRKFGWKLLVIWECQLKKRDGLKRKKDLILRKIKHSRCFVIGGGKTFSKFAPHLTHLYLTMHPIIFKRGIRVFSEIREDIFLSFIQMISVIEAEGIFQFQYKLIKADKTT